jgi:hypothetical protein
MVTDEGSGEQVPMFCSFSAITTKLPYAMDAEFKCEAPLFHPKDTAGVSAEGGLADVITPAGCDDANCLRCARHYTRCLADSRAAYPHSFPPDVGRTWTGAAALLGGGSRRLSSTPEEPDARRVINPPPPPPFDPSETERWRAIAIGTIVGTVSTILPTSSSSVVGFTLPTHVSYASQQAARLHSTFFVVLVHTLVALYIFTSDAVRLSLARVHVNLGFYTSGAELGYALLLSFGGLKQLSMLITPGLRSLLLRRLLAPRTKTQPELNALFEPTPFNLAATLGIHAEPATLNELALFTLLTRRAFEPSRGQPTRSSFWSLSRCSPRRCPSSPRLRRCCSRRA